MPHPNAASERGPFGYRPQPGGGHDGYDTWRPPEWGELLAKPFHFGGTRGILGGCIPSIETATTANRCVPKRPLGNVESMGRLETARVF
ncbi:hypothetical protein [Aporhodopirellula aestuarii]|uniref:Uncharacterized protein n=1 Tax=Aporhodopirellula aestuarii TaxID=2950107 RepID=A0ABT0U485_9BACT|nr:hypothetical protein [Aporhodopirellula aestuarii]MCM2371688.1 hypothetical protein [Aporhodopirellula aestuarii]